METAEVGVRTVDVHRAAVGVVWRTVAETVEECVQRREYPGGERIAVRRVEPTPEADPTIVRVGGTDVHPVTEVREVPGFTAFELCDELGEVMGCRGELDVVFEYEHTFEPELSRLFHDVVVALEAPPCSHGRKVAQVVGT